MRKIANLWYIEVIRAILIRIIDFNAQKRAKVIGKKAKKLKVARFARWYKIWQQLPLILVFLGAL